MDPWWEAYMDARPITRSLDFARLPEDQRMADHWADIDPWTEAFRAKAPATRESPSSHVIGSQELANWWGDIDPWWTTYTKTGHETATTIAELLTQSGLVWDDSKAPFNTDPLTADYTQHQDRRGPLQPSDEPAWSQWLAQLLDPSEALVAELFDISVERPPDEVIREDQVSKQSGGFRRADIVLRHPQRGVSIEVKLDDMNYGKTPETAQLIENKHDDLQWTHFLLLPRRQQHRLETNVAPAVEPGEDGRLQVHWTDPGPITVLYWQDVAGAIRSVLRRGHSPDDHWAANAYLFCSVLEQQLLGYQPQPVIDQLADPDGIVDTLRPVSIADTLEEQLTYLRARLET